MAVALLAQARTRIGTIRVRNLIVLVLGAVLLAGGAAGLLPAVVAVAAGLAPVAGWAAVVQVRAALAIHRVQRAFGGCRGAGFLGMAALTGALAASALPVVTPPARPLVALCGLLAVTVLAVLGMLLLPGAATTVAVRLRRGFDSLGLAVSLTLAAWLVPAGTAVPPTARAASLCASAGVAVVVVSALRATGRRPAARLCGAGATLVIAGWAVLTTLSAYDAPARTLPLAALPVLLGLTLTVAGVRRVDPTPQPPDPRDAGTQLSGYPLLAAPAAVAALAGLYHLLTVGRFDRTAIAMGIVVVIVLATREVFAVGDVRRYARRLSVHEAHFRSLVAGATDLTMVLGDDLVVRWQSPVAARLFGLSDAEVVGRPFTDLIHPHDAPRVVDLLSAVLGVPAPAGPPPLVSARLRDGHGVWRDTESTVSDQRQVPEVSALVVHVRDVGERRQLEQTVHRLAFTDQLTGLANRRELTRALSRRRGAAGHRGALLLIDLQGLAEVNNNRGREVGDAVLIEVGRRLRTLPGVDDLPARLGATEFAVITAESPVLAYALGARMVMALTAPYQLPGAIVHLRVSVGLAELNSGDSVDDVMRRADLARRRARQLGRDRVEWYDTDLEQQLLRRMDLEQGLPGAAARGELDLVYQPVLSLHDGRPVGVEALVRWRHPIAGTVMPAELLPIAEAQGVMREVGDWVLDTACRQLARWTTADSSLWLSVNVSPVELAAPDFAVRVAAVLARHRVAPDRFVLEVAEAQITADVTGMIAQFAQLRRLGVRAALDDFGVGQASLAHLRRLPVDVLKLDRALVGMAQDRHSAGEPVIEVVVGLGRRLGLEIVAEGLESAEQIELARSAGCQYGQGYALSPPAPAEHVEAFLAEHHWSS
ncbi:MAG TPA: bifunctional diguanylate cyclase/phosphodiesterase [Catenuloplanes sp.]